VERHEFQEVALADWAIEVEGNDLDDLFATATPSLGNIKG
jgi:hypothetical protein